MKKIEFKKNELISGSVILCIGLIALGVYINKGLQSFSNKERVVTVKGLAEKSIRATAATIVLSSSATGDVPQEVITKIDRNIADIKAYLKEKGYNDSKVSDIDIYDSKTYYDWDYNLDGKRIQVKKDRYKVSKSVSIVFSGEEIERTQKITKEMELDFAMKEMPVDVNCSYDFPELNTVKPELIAESTKNARIAGEQFAKDSKSKLGKIKTASQGQISIVGRYYYYDEDGDGSAPTEPYLEKARVVSTIVFFLED